MSSPPTNDPGSIHSDFQRAWVSEQVAAKVKISEVLTKPWATIMIQESGITSSKDAAYALDLACGTGVITATLYELLPPKEWQRVKVMGSDVNESMLSQLKKRGEASGWPGIETKVMSGLDPSLPSNTFTHIFINMGVYIVPADTLALAFNKLRPGGFVGISSLAAIPWHSWVSLAVSRLRNPPSMPSYEEILQKMYAGQPWGETKYIKKVLGEVGFNRVQVEEEKRRSSGTPEECLEMLHMPIVFVSAWWPEERRAELVNRVKEELLKIFIEKSEDGQVWVEMDGRVGCAWKASV
ncbi:S-adenosyl-L-methionine-dependent methyltransferase [Periconia macrospinosa]|uniref:S-adenosyl-L-methionine-dependent methyltransferase n=1 Tax=Periconia macrospinosa TaxID=97972 RepID=A0A2V1D4Z7_9PLEO|nr:S-adenosyl-L-methionine-dependent methyltransferase [Periconia macrospinosa]